MTIAFDVGGWWPDVNFTSSWNVLLSNLVIMTFATKDHSKITSLLVLSLTAVRLRKFDLLKPHSR